MILKEICERLMHMHREVITVQREMGRIGKSYRGAHMNYHIRNFVLYRRLAWVSSKERVKHFPKIMKDAAVEKKVRENLEANRRLLKVYNNLNDAGANFT